jgi:hypothetical protein
LKKICPRHDFGRAFRMNFEEFQNESRFYVVGALEPVPKSQRPFLEGFLPMI